MVGLIYKANHMIRPLVRTLVGVGGRVDFCWYYYDLCNCAGNAVVGY